MRRTWVAEIFAIALALALPAAAAGAELIPTPNALAPVQTEIPSSCQSVWKCGRRGCDWRHICPRRCPDRYSCYSLYGAYGPYGGAPYWGRYTWVGWGFYR